MATLNEASAEKKLLNVNSTQDAVQTLSLWLIHHKVHHEKLVDLWLKALKRAKMPQRLTLFYVCNEVVQTCKRKHAVIYKDAFKTVLKDAVLLVRDNSVRPNIERIFTIWGERGIYEKDFVEELQEMLANSAKVRVSTTDSKLLAEFQPQKLVEMITSFKTYESDVKGKKKLLGHLRMDASSLEAIRQLKDRAHGKEFCQQFEDSCAKLEDYASSVEKELKDRGGLIEMLEHSQIFYDAQYSEAKIVANAYRNFGTRVSNLKKKLDELKNSLPDDGSSVRSPSIGTPSPENSPAEQQDNVQAVDMELSDEDTNNTAKGSTPAKKENTITTASISLPIPSITRIRLKAKAHKLAKMQQQQQQQEEQESSYTPKSDESAPSPVGSPVDLNIPTDEMSPAKAPKLEAKPAENKGSSSIFDMLHSLATGNSTTSSFMKTSSASNATPYSSNTTSLPWETANTPVPMGVPPPSGIPTVLSTFREDGEGTPLKDEGEGGSTPVQDEAITDEIGTGGDQKIGLSNPIEFLTQLINQTKNAAPGSSDFLQNLSTLTSTMKTLSGDASDVTANRLEDNTQAASQSPSSWAAWKAQQQTAAPLPVPAPSQPPQQQQQPIPMSIPPPVSPMMQPVAPPLYQAPTIPMPTPPPIQILPPASSSTVLQHPSPHTSMAMPPLLMHPPIQPPAMPPMNIQPPPIAPPPGPPLVIETSHPPVVQPPWLRSPDGVARMHMATTPSPVNPLPPPVRPPMLSPTGKPLLPEPESPEQDFITQQPVRTPKGILRKARSNLTEIKTVSEPESEPTSPGVGVTSPYLGGKHNHTPTDERQHPLRFDGSALLGPRPPLRPPGPPRMNTSVLPGSQSTEQEEFIEKLKRKSSVTSPLEPTAPLSFNKPPGPGVGGSNLRTLTQVPLVEKNKAEDMLTKDTPESRTGSEDSDQKDSRADEAMIQDMQTDTSHHNNGSVEEDGEIKDEQPRGTPIATIGAAEPKIKSQVQKIVTVDRRDWSDRKVEPRRIESVGRRIENMERRDVYSDRRPPPPPRDQYDRRGDYYRRDGYDPYRSRDPYYRDPYARPYYPPPHRRY